MDGVGEIADVGGGDARHGDTTVPREVHRELLRQPVHLRIKRGGGGVFMYLIRHSFYYF